MGGHAIEIHDLVKRYNGTNAVDGLNLTVREGELFGLLGPNGAGKTTTIKVLCGLLEPTRGWVKVGGHSVKEEPEKVKALIGVCPQEMGVFPYLTGRENVQFFGDLYSVPKDRLRQNVNRLLDKMGLTEDADRRVKTYSGGMKRRIGLAAALVNDPRIAFLDEPTTGMDPQARRAVWEFIRELKARDTTVVLTTHYMEEAEFLCDRVAIIDHGALTALGTPEDLKREHGAANLEDVFLKLTGRGLREGI